MLRTRSALAEQLPWTRKLLNTAIDDCLVEGYETLVPALELPDPDDRHVLAAAIVGGADVIVTQNIREFPAETLAPFRIDVQHPDKFIRHMLDLDEAVALSAVRGARGALKNPHKRLKSFLIPWLSRG